MSIAPAPIVQVKIFDDYSINPAWERWFNSIGPYAESLFEGDVLIGGDLTITDEVMFSVEAGITASTTHTPGEQPLTKTFNETSIVDNSLDVVSMPTAVAGITKTITNNGDNILRVFPETGDSFSRIGTPNSLLVPPKGTVHAWAKDDSTWEWYNTGLKILPDGISYTSLSNYVFDGAGLSINKCNDNILLGYHAGNLFDESNESVIIGNNASSLISISGEGGSSVVIGHNAQGIATSGNYNVTIGWDAQRRSVAEYVYDNVSIGVNAHESGKSSQSVYIGTASGHGGNGDQYYDENLNNVGIGYYSFNEIGGSLLKSANFNTAIGGYSGLSLKSGVNNVFIGESSGIYAGDGDSDLNYSTFLGSNSGNSASGDGSVLIGYNAGYSNTTANRLIIENSNDLVTPLIDGSFADDWIKINGDLTVTGDFSVNTNKFNVTASTGATSIADDLVVATDLFIVDKSAVKVGIGRVPTQPFDVYHPTQNTIAVFQSGDNRGVIQIKDNDTSLVIGAEDGYGFFGGGTLALSKMSIETTTGAVSMSSTLETQDSITIDADTSGLYLGEDQDVLFNYDGTDCKLTTDLVGASDFVLDCGTAKTLELAVPVYDDIQFPVSGAKVPASNAPTWTTFTTNTNEYSFDVNDYIDLQANELAHWWNEGTLVYPHIHSTTNGANASGSSYYAKYTIYFAYADDDAVWTEVSRDLELEIPDGTADMTALFVNGSNIDLSGITIGTQVKIRVKRIAATSGTEFPNEIFITQVGVHALKDTMGSRAIGTK